MATFRWQNEDGSFQHLRWKALPKAKLLKLVRKELAGAAYHEDGLPVPSVKLHRVFPWRSSLCTTVAAGKAVRSQGQQATGQAATPHVPAKAPGKALAELLVAGMVAKCWVKNGCCGLHNLCLHLHFTG